MVDNPNFDLNNSPGILATKRSDFQKHIDGADFFQEATSVILEPVVSIGGNDISNVRAAIEALNAIVDTGTIQDASSTTKGILKLTNDLTGTALLPQVKGIRGRAITNATPSNGDSLVWNAGTSTWIYSTIVGTFVAGGDLTGTTTSQNVIRISGSTGTAAVGANLRFEAGFAPAISQISAAGAGNNLSISAQTSTTTNGGDLILSSGSASGSGLVGEITLRAGTTELLQLKEPSTGKYILSLGLITTGYGTDPGNGTIFINNASVAPGSNPTTGALLYSDIGAVSGAAGSLHTRRSSGTQFELGDAQSIKGIIVNITSPSDGYAITYNSGTNRWVATALSGAFAAGGDLSGSSSSQTVIGLRGVSVANTSPTVGQILTYDGSQWHPATFNTGSFTAGGDLTGSSSDQKVIGITGFDDNGVQTANAFIDSLIFDGYSSPHIYQAVHPALNTSGSDFLLSAQAGSIFSDGYNNHGGNLILSSGANGYEGDPGNLLVNIPLYDEAYDEYYDDIVLQVYGGLSTGGLAICHGSARQYGVDANNPGENILFLSPGSRNASFDYTIDEPGTNSGIMIFASDSASESRILRWADDGYTGQLNYRYFEGTYSFGSKTSGNVTVIDMETVTGFSGIPVGSTFIYEYGLQYRSATANQNAVVLASVGLVSSTLSGVFIFHATDTFNSVKIWLKISKKPTVV